MPGTVSALTMRVPATIKNRLDLAAAESGVTQAEEGAKRLWRSFDLQDQLDQPLSLLAGGEDQLVDLLRMIGSAMAAVGPVAATFSSAPKTARFRAGFWFDDPYAASKTIEAARAVLDLFTPDAAAVAAAQPQLLGEPAATLALAMLKSLPKDKAWGVVERVLDDPHRRSMLGAAVRERVIHHLGHTRENVPVTETCDATTIRSDEGAHPGEAEEK